MTKFISSEFVRYVIAGGLNYAITYAAYLLLLPLMNYSAAYAITYIAGIPLAYYLNSRFVFRQPMQWKKAFQFPLVYIARLVTEILVLSLLVEVLHVSNVIAPLLVLLVVVPLTFILSRLIIKGRAGVSNSETHP